MRILALTADASLQVAVASLAPDWDLAAVRSAADATADVDVVIIDLGSAERGVGSIVELRARGITAPCVVVGEGAAEGDPTTWFVLRPFTFSDLRMAVIAAGASAEAVPEPEPEPVPVPEPERKPKPKSAAKPKPDPRSKGAPKPSPKRAPVAEAAPLPEIAPASGVAKPVAAEVKREPRGRRARAAAKRAREAEIAATKQAATKQAATKQAPPKQAATKEAPPEIAPPEVVPPPEVEVPAARAAEPERPVVLVPPLAEPAPPPTVIAVTPEPPPAKVEPPRAAQNIVPARPVVVPPPVHRLLRLPRKRQAAQRAPRERIPAPQEPAGEMARRVQAALSAGGDLESVVEMLPGLSDLRSTAEALLAEIVDAIHPETASIYRRCGDEFVVLAGFGLTPAEMRSVVPATQALFREVTTGNGVLIDPVDLARGLVAGIAGTRPRVLMAAPLATEGWGCHGVALAGGPSFEDEMLRRMCTLAERAAPSFALAQLLERIRQSIA